MIDAVVFGLAAGAALLTGALATFALRPSGRAIGLVMGFGAGALISALSFELAEEAFRAAGADALVIGMGAGALVFFSADWVIDGAGGLHRKRHSGEQRDGTPLAIVLGTVLDGVPEALALGVALAGPVGEAGYTLLVGVVLANVPESLAATTGLSRAGYSRRSILGMWIAVTLVSAAAAAVGFGALGGAPGSVVGFVEAFAAGAVLTMLADTMMPEALKNGGRAVGLLTVLGFATAYLAALL